MSVKDLRSLMQTQRASSSQLRVQSRAEFNELELKPGNVCLMSRYFLTAVV